MVPKRPKFGLFFEKFSLVVCLLCTPSNWPKTGGQIWGPSAFKTRQTVGETGSVGSARLPRSSPTTPSATLKVRRPQYAAAGRQAASRVHYAARSAA